MFRSSKPAFLNVTVRNLPPGTTQDDVVRHINGIVLGAQPKVGPVVLDADKRMLHTSVTLQLDSDAACRNACAALHGSRFYPLNPEQPNQSADLAVKEDFLGVTTVAEHDDAQFDIYFVHGLGGHAFRTWSTTNRVPPVMWPRDLLPEDVKAAGLSGRFSTIGYQAQAFDTWSATTTIQHAARNLLVQIATDRPEGSDRPIYFVCHSLGGLVICQAILNELYLESNQTVRHEQYRRISTKDGQCLVRGIFFFGTPFEGSQLANHASKFVKFLGGNEALIDSLKFRADGLRTIVSQFNQLRNNVNTKIPILIAYEKAPLYGIKFVTRPESAMSVFEDVTSVGIDGDHKTMIKFSDRHDAGYRTISQLLIRMIASTLSIAASSPPLSPASPAKPPETSFNPTLSRRSHTMSTISSTRTMPPAYSSLLSQRPDSESTRPFSVQGALSSPTGRPLSFHPGQPISPPGTSNGGTTRLPFHHPPKAVHRANLVPVPEDGGGGTEDTTRLARLSQFDTVFVIDDSGSMNEQDGGDRSRWEVLIDSMKYIVDIVCHYDPNGVDVRFLFNDAKDESEIREGQRVLDLLSNEVEPDDGGGGTFMAQVLWMVLQDQLDRFEEFRAEMKRAASSSSRGRREARPRAPRKLNLICITDGEATDKEEVESTIVDAARRLDELKAPSNQIGIQFVQIGNNDKAAAWLKLLDDKLKQMYNVRDIVDTRPFNSPETLDLSFQQRLQRILLGAILREVDDEEDEEDQG